MKTIRIRWGIHGQDEEFAFNTLSDAELERKWNEKRGLVGPVFQSTDTEDKKDDQYLFRSPLIKHRGRS